MSDNFFTKANQNTVITIPRLLCFLSVFSTKKINQKFLLAPLFFILSIFSNSALAACDLSLSANLTYKNLSVDGALALSPVGQSIYTAATGKVPGGDIIAACGSDREFIFAENTYKCETSGTGRVWFDRNLGASKVCTALNEGACFGDYYQWGRNKDGHEDKDSTPDSTQIAYATTDNTNFITNNRDWALGDNDRALRAARWSEPDGSGVCPAGFSVPTSAELLAELGSWAAAPQTNADAFASALKWPSTPFRLSGGNLSFTSTRIWSATLTSEDHPHYLNFHSLSSLILEANGPGGRVTDGYPVRCIQQAAIAAPDAPTAALNSAGGITLSWNAVTTNGVSLYKIYRATTTATAVAVEITEQSGLSYTDVTNLETNTSYHYWVRACVDTDNCSAFSAQVIITTGATVPAPAPIAPQAPADLCGTAFTFEEKEYQCVTAPSNRVWLDRNLGADEVCDDTDHAECYGDLYQWGRNKDGHESRTSDTSGTQIAYTTTDNANFITGNADWATGDDNGAMRATRWSATDGTSICPIGFRVPTATEIEDLPFDFEELALPAERRIGGDVGEDFQSANFWSTTPINGSQSSSLFITEDSQSIFNSNRVSGYSIRCVQDLTP